MPALNYYEVNGDSQVSATITLSNGCLQPTSWGTPVQSENNFSVTAKVTDYSGPQISCTLAIVNVQHTYSLGQLAVGNYSFTFNVCIAFPNYGGTVECNNNRATIFFQAGNSTPKPPANDKIELAYQEVNGTSYVKASIVVPTCFRMRGWSDASQSGNSFRSNVTIVDDSRLMIACILMNLLTFHSYDLGHLSPGLYSFTLDLCKVFIGWGTGNTTPNTPSDLVGIWPNYTVKDWHYDLDPETYRLPLGSAYTGKGADITRLRSALGMVDQPQALFDASNNLVVTWLAPDAQACSIDTSATGDLINGFTRNKTDTGVVRVRKITIPAAGFTAQTTYKVRINCEREAPVLTTRSN